MCQLNRAPPCERRRTGGAGGRKNADRSCAAQIDEAALQQKELDSELKNAQSPFIATSTGALPTWVSLWTA